MKNGLRMTEAEGAALLERMARHGKPAPSPRAPRRDPAPADAPAKTSTQRLQALGRMQKGEMNATEARYAALLDEQKAAGVVAWYAFEQIKLMLAKNTSLTVDFFVMYADGRLEAHDVKGAKAVVTDDARAKMKIAAGTFPWPFKLVYPRAKKAGGGWDVEVIGE